MPANSRVRYSLAIECNPNGQSSVRMRIEGSKGKPKKPSTNRGRTNRLRRLSSGRTRQMQQTGVIAGALRHAIRHIQQSLLGSRIAHLLTGNNLNRSEFRVSNIRPEHQVPARTRETYIIDCLGVIVARFLLRTLI